jgi:hypothetical protein
MDVITLINLISARMDGVLEVRMTYIDAFKRCSSTPERYSLFEEDRAIVSRFGKWSCEKDGTI